MLSIPIIFLCFAKKRFADSDTIVKTKAPRAFEKYMKYYNENDGFLIPQHLIFELSPQLGAPKEDFSSEISLIKIQNGMDLATLYQTCSKLSITIELQKDSSGAIIRLIQRFISLLCLIPAYDEIMIPIERDTTIYIQHHGYNMFNIHPPPHTIPTIYNDIIVIQSLP